MLYEMKKSYSLNLKKYNSEEYLKFLCEYYNLPPGYCKSDHLRQLLAHKPKGLKII